MSITTRYNNLSIRHKLRLVIMVTVGTALMFACAAVLAYDQISARNSIRNDLGVLAEIFSANSTAALSFNDAPAAAELLSSLRAKQHLVRAFIYSADGKLFADYHRASGSTPSIVPRPRP